MISMKKTVLVAGLTMAFGASAVQAMGVPVVTTTGNNFSMVGATGGSTGGNNDTVFSWDGTFKSTVANDNSFNATLSSVSKFGGYSWVAHNVNIYGPGSYTFDTGAPTGAASTATAAPDYNMTVGAGQVGAHMLFDWGATSTTTACGKANCNIDVVVLWNLNQAWGTSASSGVFKTNTTSTNSTSTVWSGLSVDTDMDSNTFNGTAMVDGAFVGQSANFNVMGITAAPSAVPVPAAAWLLGSGLLGLVGVARRKAA